MHKFCYFVLISIMITSCGPSKKVNPTPMVNKTTAVKTRVIAHRGAWKNTNTPENSVAALKEAIRMGCYGSEMDVHMTSDGFIVVNHDHTFHGMDIQNSTLAELRKFKLSNREPLPLLSDFLKVITSQDGTRLILEIKPSRRGKDWAIQTANAVTSEVDKYKAGPITDYISFDFDICLQVRRNVPDAHVQYLNGDKTPQEVKAAGISGIDYHYSVFQKHPEYLVQCKELGVATNAWTVNDPVVMDWLIAHQIDFITTNEPELLFVRLEKSPLARGYQLAWSDEFLYSGLPDSSKWSFEEGGHGWGNNEKQYYTKGDTANAVVKKGVLKITARKEQKEKSPYTSARLVTKGKAAWTYGRIEARAKLPAGIGLWPAFWMLGSNISEVGWPECGEIDIMEHVGYRPNEILGTVHTGAFNHIKGTQKGGKFALKHPYDRFHTFAIEWDATGIRFFVDDNPYNEFKNEYATTAEWPFSSPFFIILNMAVGGNLGGKEGIDDRAFPAEFIIDYVRVYQK